VTAQRLPEVNPAKDALCTLAKGLNGTADAIMRGGKGTYFNNIGGQLTAGLGMNVSYTVYAQPSTGEYGYFTSVGFSVGLQIGGGAEVGYYSGSPLDLANSYSFSVAAIFGGTIYMPDVWHPRGASMAVPLSNPIPELKVGVSISDSEVVNWVTC
jgi:hypothetical protein